MKKKRERFDSKEFVHFFLARVCALLDYENFVLMGFSPFHPLFI